MRITNTFTRIICIIVHIAEAIVVNLFNYLCIVYASICVLFAYVFIVLVRINTLCIVCVGVCFCVCVCGEYAFVSGNAGKGRG